ncbi:Plasma membrane iron permease [Colletotrichum tanaceti]|uniref:Plasma membrane iron permease n=1 Tax=Colletotrichum tanaceti TaxID=1306861 RepID=A0A4U6X2D8_9PEZI|nr:Plasma membrane iron permease [Colletotrichum tanaceti]
MEDLFSLPIFFITFRESLETAIIVSVLLAFIKRTLATKDDPALQHKMERQVWLGTAAGLVTCVIIAMAIISGIHSLGADRFAAAESIWEGIFSLGASLIITAMGAVLLRVTKLQDKWRLKLSKALSATESHDGPFRDRLKYLGEKYALFLLPFVTVLREGFEGVLFIAGVGVSETAASIALSAVLGLALGAVVGYFIYRGSKTAPIQVFLIVSTCFLYLIAAGLFSKGVWHFEQNEWNKIVGGDAAELGSGPGSYDIRRSVWHVNCCNPDLNGGGFWGIFNAVLGWQNSATVGSVVSYNLYWVAVATGFFTMICREKGYWPFARKETKQELGHEGDDQEPLLSRPARLLSFGLDPSPGFSADRPKLA